MRKSIYEEINHHEIDMGGITDTYRQFSLGPVQLGSACKIPWYFGMMSINAMPEVFTCYLVSDTRGNLYLIKLDEPTISKILSKRTIRSKSFRKKQTLGSRQHIFKQAVLKRHL